MQIWIHFDANYRVESIEQLFGGVGEREVGSRGKVGDDGSDPNNEVSGDAEDTGQDDRCGSIYSGCTLIRMPSAVRREPT